MQRYLMTLFLLLSIALQAAAQYAAAFKDSITSNVLNEKRNIEIILPDNYAGSNMNYDVWYVLDGEWNTHTFTNIQSYLVAIGFAPRVIIVGVPNRYVNGYNLRDRDLTPTVTKEIDNSGGAKNFLAFLQQELMPYIKTRYRTSGINGLFGSSFGGLFAMYTLLEQPGLFRFYALADPAFQYDNGYLPKVAAKRLPGLTLKRTVLNIGGRSGESYQLMVRDRIDSLLHASAPAELHWHSALYDDETHNSSLFKSNYDGLKYAYMGYSMVNAVFHLTGGIVLKDRPVRLFVNTDHADVRYTTDGTEPGDSAQQARSFILVSDPDRTVVKSFSPSGLFDRIIPMGLHSGTYVLPKRISKQVRAAGKLGNSTIMRNGLMNGFVTIDRDGYYVIQLTPSEKTRLYFNDSLFVAYNPKTGHARQTIILPLRKGDYAFRLEHSPNPNDPPLYFGLYYSENGQDDWWQNPIVSIDVLHSFFNEMTRQ